MKVYIIILKKNLMHLLIEKFKIKDEIRKNLIPFGIKPKCIFNKVSQETRFICFEYNVVKISNNKKLK